jgi:hypothetical protein
MKTQRLLALSILLAVVPVLAAQNPQPIDKPTTKAPGQYTAPTKEETKPVVIPDRRLTKDGKMDLIRGMTAEMGFARKPFPLGKTGLTLNAKSGVITPDNQQLEEIMAAYGPALKPGDRARITDIKFKDKSVIFEINGGPQKKKKWYEHIQVSGMGGAVQPGQPTDNTNIHGSFVELSFDKFVPDLKTDQVKRLLDPVLNFNAKSATEAYLDTIPPQAKKAITDHKALVGMNREMVTYAKGRPPMKDREKDGDVEYEEWIYGTPPQDVEFIRFVGDVVVRIETMQVDGTKVVRTQPEVVLKKDEPEVAQDASGQPAASTTQGQAQPTATQGADGGPVGRPTLRRPGEDTTIGQPTPSDPAPTRLPQPAPSPTGSPNPTVPKL